MKKQILKLLDTSGKNETLAVRADSSIEKSSRKQQKARKKSKSVNRVNK